jgi:hypothetical protein
VHAGKVARVLAHLGDDLVLGDRQRHRPGRIEIDRRDGCGQRRRGLVGLADDHDIAALHLVVGNRLGERGRDVDDDIAVAEHEIHAGEPTERGFELLDALSHRHVEGRQRLRADTTGRRQAVAQLKMLYRLDERLVVGVAAFPLGRQIFGDREAAAQQRDRGSVRSRRQLGVGRQGRPAPAHLQIGIAEHGLLDALVCALVENGFARQRQGGGGTRGRGRRRGLCGGRGRRPCRRGRCDARSRRGQRCRPGGRCDRGCRPYRRGV